ncbi:Endonuclease/exonuclease/phosphatase [Tribonema minus]|uniref:Endonuclease/exonuclease/phosphatase n=1 Tax=Tribonema minus TaxID=303371 RepID=A0A835ZAD2_9STRA|nr:Endonuclease/exonuclease/phosphatase [Tribonema minus]
MSGIRQRGREPTPADAVAQQSVRHSHHVANTSRSPRHRGAGQGSLVLTTFNLLAPVYKRIDEQALRKEGLRPQSVDPEGGLLESLKETWQGRPSRESECDAMWRARARSTVEFVKESMTGSDIICFQEYWFQDAYQELFREQLEQEYSFFTKQRTGHKADGIAILLRKGSAAAAAAQGVSLCSIGNRVALLLHVKPEGGRDFLLANCHLTFPHNLFDRQLQQQQIQGVTAALDEFAEQEGLAVDTPRVIVGDFNVEESDPVCAHLRDLGYKSAFSTLHSTDKHVVTHYNHNAEEVMVDHVWVLGLADSQHQRRGESPEGESQQEGEGGAGAPGLSIGKALLLPKGVDDSRWNRSFALSDHRPLQVRIDWPQAQARSARDAQA